MEPGVKGKWFLIGALVLVVLISAFFFMKMSWTQDANETALSKEEELAMKHRVLEELASVTEEENARENLEASSTESGTAEVDTGPTKNEKLDVLKALRAE